MNHLLERLPKFWAKTYVLHELMATRCLRTVDMGRSIFCGCEFGIASTVLCYGLVKVAGLHLSTCEAGTRYQSYLPSLHVWHCELEGLDWHVHLARRNHEASALVATQEHGKPLGMSKPLVRMVATIEHGESLGMLSMCIAPLLHVVT